MGFVNIALSDADIILYVTDVAERPGEENEYISKIRQSEVPVIVAVNKIDLSNQDCTRADCKIVGDGFPSFPCDSGLSLAWL